MENVWVDFKAIKAEVSMRMVLDHYGLAAGFKASGDELRGRCPIHKGEGADAFHVNVEKNCFQCFAGSCKKRGNVLDFVAAMEQSTVRDAAVKIAQWFSIGGERSQNGNVQRKAVAPESGGVGQAPTATDTEAAAENEALTFQLKGVNPDHRTWLSAGSRRRQRNFSELDSFRARA